MQTSVRSITVFTAIAAVAIVGLSLAAEASPASTGDGTNGLTVVRAPGPAASPTPPSSPVVVAQRAEPPVADVSAVSQTVAFEVIGGSLDVVADGSTVALERVAGSARDWTGTLPQVRVVDARGTLEGWVVEWSVAGLEVDGDGPAAHVPSARVRVEPEAPTVVYGAPEGLFAGRARHALFGADAGTGGGTYAAGGTVTLRLPRSVDADSVIVDLVFSVH